MGDDGVCTLPMRFRLLSSAVGERSRFTRSSIVLVRGRMLLCGGASRPLSTACGCCPLLRLLLRASIPAGWTPLPFLLLGGLVCEVRASRCHSRSFTSLLLLLALLPGPFNEAAGPPTIVVVVRGMKTCSKLIVLRSGTMAVSSGLRSGSKARSGVTARMDEIVPLPRARPAAVSPRRRGVLPRRAACDCCNGVCARCDVFSSFNHSSYSVGSLFLLSSVHRWRCPPFAPFSSAMSSVRTSLSPKPSCPVAPLPRRKCLRSARARSAVHVAVHLCTPWMLTTRRHRAQYYQTGASVHTYVCGLNPPAACKDEVCRLQRPAGKVLKTVCQSADEQESPMKTSRARSSHRHH